MPRVAIIGSGPTGTYSLLSLLDHPVPLDITIFERGQDAGVGMPYRPDATSPLMLANSASVEIPPLTCSLLDWLRRQSADYLDRYGLVADQLTERLFVPRLVIGDFFRAQFQALLRRGEASGHKITVFCGQPVTDLMVLADGVALWAEGKAQSHPFDLVVIATGHHWPGDNPGRQASGGNFGSGYYQSPWAGLLTGRVPAGDVGILGTSLSAIDACMAVAGRHGRFVEGQNGCQRFELLGDSAALKITMMSRSGFLPEADFYCPLPYGPLGIATPAALAQLVSAGQDGLLDRIFEVAVAEVTAADPGFARRNRIDRLTADNVATAYFAPRARSDALEWAAINLRQAARDYRRQRICMWRYTILRLHQVVHGLIRHLSDNDRQRFDQGMSRVFADNFAAVPHLSIHRLLALQKVGILRVRPLGAAYEMQVTDDSVSIRTATFRQRFGTFIDARGQRSMTVEDLPFPSLRRQMQSLGMSVPAVGADYTLLRPAGRRGRIAFAALPYLLREQPYIQGLQSSAEIGAEIARSFLASQLTDFPGGNLLKRIIVHNSSQRPCNDLPGGYIEGLGVDG